MGVSSFFGDLKVLANAAIQKANPPTSETLASIPGLVEKNASDAPGATALICEEEKVSWKELNERANRVAAVLKTKGIAKDDCVSLFMQNRIEFVVCMLGILKLGAHVGMINTNLTRQQLTHCISLIDSKMCIFGEELIEPLDEIRDQLELKDGEDYLYVADHGETPAPEWAQTLDSNDSSLPSENHTITGTLKMGDVALYIFTSGTTGLPKAAIVSNKRILPNSATSATALLRITAEDRMYNCLPLYHGTGLMIGLIAAFHVGASTVLRRRLSVSAFWDDIRKYQCTSFVYIGEFIRYLMSRAPQKDDAYNPVRTIVGNGLRPDIWMEFKERFDIERIGEFYGASEGNGGFANVFNKNCTVGLGVAPVKLVKYDIETDEIIRDANGFCQEVPDGEAGLLLIQITEHTKFEGYTNKDASDKKLVPDALEKGDLYFNSGDMMKVVDVGFAFGQKHYQFVDRIGDTFRWKSENVSTNEVGEIINQYSDVVFTNVYGVEIPGTDGKAGMAAMVLKEGMSLSDLDLSAFSEHICENLPSYARPIFIRVLKDLPATSTHKMQKNDLRKSAFHLDKVEDELLIMKPGSQCYEKLDCDYYDQIMARNIAF